MSHRTSPVHAGVATLAAVTAFLAVPGATPAAGQSWGSGGVTVTPLPSGLTVYAGGVVNNAGQVVGYGRFNGTYHDAFLYSGGSLQNLGTIGTDRDDLGLGVNNLGEATGYSHNGSYNEAFLHSGGGMQGLGALSSSNPHSAGYGINDAGHVVGQSRSSSGYTEAFLYANGSMQGLGTLGGGAASFAFEVNNLGQVAGYSHNGSYYEAFLYSGGSMQGLGHLGGAYSIAYDLNDSGQVTGVSHNGSHYEAFLYSGGSLQGLGTFGGNDSRAWAINEAGQVFGYSQNASNTNRAALWENGTAYDVNDIVGAGANFSQIRGVSDDGRYAVALGYYGTRGHGFYLLEANNAAVVPEPSALLLLGTGLIGMGLMARRRREKDGVAGA